jgi:hypothetical protein
MVETAGHSFGLRQVVQTPGEFRWTQVWMGRYSFNMRCRAGEVIALVLLRPLDIIPTLWYRVEWTSFGRLP